MLYIYQDANIAQLVEHSHGKGEVIGSIPIVGSMFKKNTIKLLFLVIFLVFLTVIFSFIDNEYLQKSVLSAGIWAPLVFIFLKSITVILAPLSGSFLYIIATPIFGFWNGLFYALMGDILGATVTFYISRIFGKDLMEKFAGSTTPLIYKMVKSMGTVKGFLYARFALIAVPEVASYAAGLTAISFWRFLPIHMLIDLIPILFMMSPGILTKYATVYHSLLIIGIGTIVAIFGMFLFYKYTYKENENK